MDVVAKQKSIGIDIPSDGEMSKISYATYISERISGFAGDSPRRPPQLIYVAFLVILKKLLLVEVLQLIKDLSV